MPALTPSLVIRGAAALSVVLALAALGWWLGPAAGGAGTGFLLDRDQQGQRLLSAGNPAAAAERFVDPAWLGAARFRARDFEGAAAAFSAVDDAESAYNGGNALVMLGRYEEAAARYRRALELRPDWTEAGDNLDIALARAERVRREGGEMTGGKLGADEIRFESGPAGSGGDEVTVSGDEDPGAMNDIWLRRVQTRPADFLRAKFAYQQAMASRAGSSQ